MKTIPITNNFALNFGDIDGVIHENLTAWLGKGHYSWPDIKMEASVYIFGPIRLVHYSSLKDPHA